MNVCIGQIESQVLLIFYKLAVFAVLVNCLDRINDAHSKSFYKTKIKFLNACKNILIDLYLTCIDIFIKNLYKLCYFSTNEATTGNHTARLRQLI
jgi:hypothetical protein